MAVRSAMMIAGLASLLTAGAAPAAPITINPGSLTATGTVKAGFAYADAADTSTLLRLGFGGVIFQNNGIGADAVGTVKTLTPANVGLIQFTLTNTTMNYSFTNDVADAGDFNRYHALYSTRANINTTFNVPFLAAVLANLDAQLGPNAFFVGFEDRRASSDSDYDYNDLIFAFSAVQVVPEPASMALVGAGLLGLGLVRRRRAG